MLYFNKGCHTKFSICSFHNSQYLSSTMHLVTLHWQISQRLHSSDCSWNLKLISYIADHYYLTSTYICDCDVHIQGFSTATCFYHVWSDATWYFTCLCVRGCMHAHRGIWKVSHVDIRTIPAITTTGEHVYMHIAEWRHISGWYTGYLQLYEIHIKKNTHVQ